MAMYQSKIGRLLPILALSLLACAQAQAQAKSPRAQKEAASQTPPATPAASSATAPKASKDDPVKWGLVCNQGGDCKSSIKLPIDNGGGDLEIWVGKSGKDRYLGVMTPLGIYIPSGVVLSFDRGKTAFAKMNLLECKPAGCRSVVALSKDLEANLRKKKDFAVIIKDSTTRKNLGLLVTLEGFTTGMEKLASR